MDIPAYIRANPEAVITGILTTIVGYVFILVVVVAISQYEK